MKVNLIITDDGEGGEFNLCAYLVNDSEIKEDNKLLIAHGEFLVDLLEDLYEVFQNLSHTGFLLEERLKYTKDGKVQ